MQSCRLECGARRLFSQPHSFVPGQDAASQRNPVELRPPLVLLLEETALLAPLRSQKVPSSALVDTASDVVEVPVSTSSTVPPPVFRISGFQKTEYRTDGLNVEHPTQTSRLGNGDHVEKLRTLICKGECVTAFGSFAGVKKNCSSDRLSVPSLDFYGKLAVLLYLFDGFHRDKIA